MIRTALTVLVILCALALSLGPVSAKPICEGGEEIWNDIMLYGFRVNADQPINVGDVVYYDFYIKNTGSEPIKIGKGGIYLKTSLGDKYSFYAGEILDPGKSAHISSSFRVSEAGGMKINPGICVSAEGGDVCHDFETTCSFEVFIECPEGTICMTPEQASQGNYIRVSDEICGYEGKVPMYCYREVFECPETCQCLPQSEAEKNGMVPCGGLSELKFCGYKDGEEMYCYQRDLPDLRISDVWPYPTSDAYTEIRALVYNYGGYAGNSTVAFFVDGEKVGEVEIKGLKYNENLVAELQLPTTRICSGTEDVFKAIADYHEEINESDENNSCSRVYECLGAELPDLEVIDVWHEGEENYTCMIREYTDENRIWFAVRNSGNSASQRAEIRLYIDGNWRATTTIPPLDPNKEHKGNFSYRGMCSGESDIIKIVIDPQNNIPEIDDVNNELEEVWNCIVTPKEKPDLIIRNLIIEGLHEYHYQILPHYTYPIKYEIQNQGEGYACGSHTGLYVDDVLVATDYVDRLAPGESVEKTFWWNYSMRECTPPSDTIRVVADYRNEIEEISEDNNEYSLSFECIPVNFTPPVLPPGPPVSPPPVRPVFTFYNGGRVVSSSVPIFGFPDEDEDGINDHWENQAMVELNPWIELDEEEGFLSENPGFKSTFSGKDITIDEMNSQNHKVVNFVRVTPYPEDNPEYILFYYVMSWTKDYGRHEFVAHNGDTERLIMVWRIINDTTIQLECIYIGAHGGCNKRDDIWEPVGVSCNEAGVCDATWNRVGTERICSKLEFYNNRLKLYVSEDKHALYPTCQACEAVTLVIPNLSGLEWDRGTIFNVLAGIWRFLFYNIWEWTIGAIIEAFEDDHLGDQVVVLNYPELRDMIRGTTGTVYRPLIFRGGDYEYHLNYHIEADFTDEEHPHVRIVVDNLYCADETNTFFDEWGSDEPYLIITGFRMNLEGADAWRVGEPYFGGVDDNERREINMVVFNGSIDPYTTVGFSASLFEDDGSTTGESDRRDGGEEVAEELRRSLRGEEVGGECGENIFKRIFGAEVDEDCSGGGVYRFPVVNVGEPDHLLIGDLSAYGFPGEDVSGRRCDDSLKFCGGLGCNPCVCTPILEKIKGIPDKLRDRIER